MTKWKTLRKERQVAPVSYTIEKYRLPVCRTYCRLTLQCWHRISVHIGSAGGLQTFLSPSVRNPLLFRWNFKNSITGTPPAAIHQERTSAVSFFLFSSWKRQEYTLLWVQPKIKVNQEKGKTEVCRKGFGIKERKDRGSWEVAEGNQSSGNTIEGKGYQLEDGRDRKG